MQVFTITCLITFLWLCFGYSLAFGPALPEPYAKSNPIYGDASRFWLRGEVQILQKKLDSFTKKLLLIINSSFHTRFARELLSSTRTFDSRVRVLHVSANLRHYHTRFDLWQLR